MVKNHSVTDIRAIVTKRTGLIQKSSHVSQRQVIVVCLSSCTKTDPSVRSRSLLYTMTLKAPRGRKVAFHSKN